MRILRDHLAIETKEDGSEVEHGGKLNTAIRVEAADEDVYFPDGTRKPSWNYTIYVKANNFSQEMCKIRFQHEALREFVNARWIENEPKGISIESLLTVCLDRLREFQRGPYKCESNAAAISHLERGLKILLDRQQDRQKRNVEGQHKL